MAPRQTPIVALTARRGIVAMLLCCQLGCNAIFGVDDLRFDPAGSGGEHAGGNGGSGGVVMGPCEPPATRACYSGPAGTEGIGVCQGGVQICTSGGTWGLCEGEVVPGSDDCATPADENCDSFACGDTTWALTLGGPGNEQALGVAAFADGRWAVVGAYDGGGPTLGSDVLPTKAAGMPNGFVAWVSADGQILSARAVEGSANVRAQRVAAAPDGSLFVCGSFAGTLNTSATSLMSRGGGDGFVAKLDSGGVVMWVKRFGGGGDDDCDAVALLGDGDVVVAATFYGNGGDWDGAPLPEFGNYDALWARMNGPTGALGWARVHGGAGLQLSTSVAAAASGGVAVAGYFQNTINLGSSPLVSAGDYDLFVGELDAQGTVVWSKRFGDANVQRLHHMAVDPTGNLLVAGLFDGDLDFGGGVLPSPGAESMFVAKLDSAGNHLWSRAYGGPNNDAASGVGAGADARVWLTGRVDTSVDFGGGPLMGNAGQPNVTVTRFDAAGNVVVGRLFNVQGDPGPGAPLSYWRGWRQLAVGADGSAMVVGYFHTAIDFAPPPLMSVGAADAFAARFAP